MAGFKTWWLSDENYKRWIVKVENSSTRVYCRFCQKLLDAHTSHLLGHSKTILHQRIDTEYEECDSNCPYFEKITVSVDENGEPVVRKLNTKTPGDACGFSSYMKPVDGNSWIQHNEHKNRLIKTSFCMQCKKNTCANSACLVLHSKTTAHQRNMNKVMFSSIGNMDNSRQCYEHQICDYEEAIDDSTAGCSGMMDYEPKNVSLVPFGIMEPEDSPMLSAVPMSCDIRENDDPPRKRQKIDTQFLLDAIGNGYFEKEDLRRIANRVIDKLSE